MLGRRSSIVYSHSKTYFCHNRPRPSRHFEKLGLVNVSLSLLQTRLHPPLLNDQAIWENGLEPVLKKDNMINIDISTLKKKLTDSNPWASLCCTGRPPNRLSSSTACGGIGCERIRLQQMNTLTHYFANDHSADHSGWESMLQIKSNAHTITTFMVVSACWAVRELTS